MPKTPKQKGGFELAGPAAAGFLLLAEEIARRRMKASKSKKSMKGGSSMITEVLVKYDDGTLVKLDDDQLKTVQNALSVAAAAADAVVAQEGLEAVTQADGQDAVTPLEGGRKGSKGRKGAKRGGGVIEHMDSVGKEIADKFVAQFQGVASQVASNASMVPAVPMPPVPPMDGGAKKKRSAKKGKKAMKGGDCGEHFGGDIVAPPAAPADAVALAVAAPTPGTFSGGAKRPRKQRGGSFGGMIGGLQI